LARRAKPLPSRARLLELLNYDPKTGVFRWRIDRQRARAGDLAGGDNGCGYIRINIDGGLYTAHRLAWLIVTGEEPDLCLDHINGDTADNRIANLRRASFSENMANRKVNKDSSLGIKGVQIRAHRNKSYVARIQVDGRRKLIGYYNTADEAAAAYAAAADKYFGEFARTE
jgi:hypothetical protein